MRKAEGGALSLPDSAGWILLSKGSDASLQGRELADRFFLFLLSKYKLHVFKM